MEKQYECNNCPKMINTDVDVANSVPPVSIAGERNALSRRQEGDSVMYIRRQCVATESRRHSWKKANDRNELSATADASTLFHLTHLRVGLYRICSFFLVIRPEIPD